MTHNLLPVVLCAMAVTVSLTATRLGRPVIAGVAKLLASSAFVWAAIAWGAAGTGYGRVLLAGLAASWVGDALLIRRGTTPVFRLGIAAFLLAHVAYTIAFWLLPTDPGALALAAGAGTLAGWSILRWLRPHLPAAMRLPVLAYVVAIFCMVAVAVAATAAGGPAVIAAGAVAFALSDLSVARDRFVAAGLFNRLWGQPLYFGAQLLLAWSAIGVAQNSV